MGPFEVPMLCTAWGPSVGVPLFPITFAQLSTPKSSDGHKVSETQRTFSSERENAFSGDRGPATCCRIAWPRKATDTSPMTPSGAARLVLPGSELRQR